MQVWLTHLRDEAAGRITNDGPIGHSLPCCRRPMTAGRAAYEASVRRWDIDDAILASLQEQLKTASRLFRDLNPGIRSQKHAKHKGVNNRLKGITLDGRQILGHLKWLERHGYIGRFRQLKVLEGRREIARWTVTYYYIIEQILPMGCGVWYPDTLPTTAFIRTNENHPETCLEFTTWLRDPQGIRG